MESAGGTVEGSSYLLFLVSELIESIAPVKRALERRKQLTEVREAVGTSTAGTLLENTPKQLCGPVGQSNRHSWKVLSVHRARKYKAKGVAGQL
jgi:hypothetical protein